MTQLVAKLMLALLMLPTAALLYLVCVIAAFETIGWRAEDAIFVCTTVLVLGYVGIYWVRLWHKSVTWTKRRVNLTIIVSVITLLTALGIGGMMGALVDFSFGAFMFGVAGGILWPFLTVLIWRETNAERSNRVRASGSATVSCLTCGYNLTGLKHTTCPECGAKPTIEELLAGQDSRADAELEDARGE